MRVAGVPEVLAEVIHEPQLRVVLHEAEVVVRKLLSLLIDVIADVAGVTEHLSQNRMDLHPHLSLPEYLTAGLKGSKVRGHQHHIDVLVLQGCLGPLALLDSLASDGAVDVVLGI